MNSNSVYYDNRKEEIKKIMKNLTLENIAQVCGGTYYGSADKLQEEVTSIITDSRKAENGCLFVPIVGERVDAHKFIPQVMAAGALALIADISIEQFAKEMFRAGSNLKDKSPEEIFYQDFKKFVLGDVTLGVGQITSMTAKELEEIKGKMIPYLQKALVEHEVEMIYFMLTNIMEESTELLYAGSGAKELAIAAFALPADTEKIVLEHVVSRKKQVIPALLIALQE